MVKVTYFAHGATLSNDAHISTGWYMGEISELSQRGIEQNKKTKEMINIEDYDLVFTSDFSRSIETAKQIFEDKKEIIQDERTRECNYGDFNGKDSHLVKYIEHIYDKFPNGESLTDVEKRMRDFCNYLLANYDGKHIALVTHKATNLALEVILNNKTWEQAINEDWRKTRSWIPETYIIK